MIKIEMLQNIKSKSWYINSKLIICQCKNDNSCVKGYYHARLRERVGVKIPLFTPTKLSVSEFMGF